MFPLYFREPLVPVKTFLGSNYDSRGLKSDDYSASNQPLLCNTPILLLRIIIKY